MKKDMPKAPETTKAVTRQGKRAIAGYYPDRVWLQFKTLGLEQGGKSVQDLLAEAINLLFEKYGKKPIA